MLNPMVDQALQAIKSDIAKAAEVVGTYTFSPATRSIFSPENLDEKIKYLAPIDTPVRNRLPRVGGKGQATTWKVMSSKLHVNVSSLSGAGAGTGTSQFFADAGSPGETAQTYSTSTQSFQLLGRKLEVGGLALAASKGREGQADMQVDREKIKMVEVMIGEEEAILNADSDNSNEFDGIFKQITTNSGTCTFLTASGIGNNARTLFNEGGDPTLLLASARQLQALADDLERSGTIQRNVISSQQGVVGGFALNKIVNPVTQSLIDVKPSRFVGRSSLLLTEKSAAGETWIEMEDLIPMSRVDVPSSSFSFVSFILEATVVKVMGEPFQMEITTGA